MKYPIGLDIPVAWGEMDAFGHVNNVVFFRYFESIRIEYFLAVTGGEVTTDGFVPILANAQCDYLRPVYFPDTLRAEASVTRVGTSSLDMEYRLLSRSQGVEVARGKAVVVNIDPTTGKGVAISEEFKQRISELETPPC